MNENPVVLGMLGPFLTTLGFGSSESPESTLFVDPKYSTDENGREWSNDR